MTKSIESIKTKLPAISLPESALTALRGVSDPIIAIGRKFAERVELDAKEIEVTSAQSREFAIMLIREIETQSDAFEQARFAETKPLDELKRQAMERYRPFVDGTRAGARIIRDKIAAFDGAQKRLADEARAEAERLEREQREKLEAEQARLHEAARKAAKKGDDKKAARLIEQANAVEDRMDTVAAAPLPNAFRVPTVAGTSERETWTFEVCDLLALIIACADEMRGTSPDDRLLQFIKADEVEIGKVVRALRQNHRIPGVVAKRKDTLAIRK